MAVRDPAQDAEQSWGIPADKARPLAVLGALYEALNRGAARVPGVQAGSSVLARGGEAVREWAAEPASRDVQKSREMFSRLYDFFVPQDAASAVLSVIPPIKGIGPAKGLLREAAGSLSVPKLPTMVPFKTARATRDALKGISPERLAHQQALFDQRLRRFGVDKLLSRSGDRAAVALTLRQAERAVLKKNYSRVEARLDLLRTWLPEAEVARLRMALGIPPVRPVK